MFPLAAAVSPFVLSVLKYAFLALVYFFVFRALRTVAVDVSGRRARAPDRRPPRPVAAGGPVPRRATCGSRTGTRPSSTPGCTRRTGPGTWRTWAPPTGPT